jgi:hypothetical protein
MRVLAGVFGAAALAAPVSGAALPSAVSVRCTLPNDITHTGSTYAFAVVNDLSGVRVMTNPTGQGPNTVFAQLTAVSRRLNPMCAQTKPSKHDFRGLAGPWTISRKNVVSCGSDTRRDLVITIAPIRGARKRLTGNRLLATIGRETLVRVDVKRRSGGIWIDAATCGRASG